MGTHTLPILLLGIMNLIVTGRLPGKEAWSKGSSLILRTINPKACPQTSVTINQFVQERATTSSLTLATASKAPWTLKILSGLPGIDSEMLTLAPDWF